MVLKGLGVKLVERKSLVSCNRGHKGDVFVLMAVVLLVAMIGGRWCVELTA